MRGSRRGQLSDRAQKGSVLRERVSAGIFSICLPSASAKSSWIRSRICLELWGCLVPKVLLQLIQWLSKQTHSTWHMGKEGGNARAGSRRRETDCVVAQHIQLDLVKSATPLSMLRLSGPRATWKMTSLQATATFSGNDNRGNQAGLCKAGKYHKCIQQPARQEVIYIINDLVD
ncbi:hypothetical protein VTN77DRAFT_5526 [Rasamsonia byssochlamydoides]|uniref:uncharacterized protein n=1 Tax=Rasamsonia byssochlamydoides TaxID=89139 RepID=UPI0037441823